MYEFHTTPFAHQAKAFAEHAQKPAWGHLWEQGTGKTKIAIDTACDLYERGEVDAVLVVAPNGVHRNWFTDELPAHTPPRLRDALRGHFWRTSSAETQWHKREAEQLLKHRGFAWLFMSYEAFRTNKAKAFIWRFLKQRKVLYILDEAHNIKTPGAKRTVSIVASAKYAKYRRILTGTPVAQGPFDLYSQLKFLDASIWKDEGIMDFATFKTYFGIWLTRAEVQEKKGYDPGYDQLVGYKHLDELNRILARHSDRVLKEEAVDLPPKLYSKRYHDLNPEQARVYGELRDEYMAELADGTLVTAALAIVRLLRFQQVVCGYVAETGEPHQLLGKTNPRMNLLAETVDGVTTQGIIWARFTKDIDLIMAQLERMGLSAVRYDGTVTDDEAAANKARFQAGDAQWLVGNQQKGKEGLTLVGAKVVIYYNNSFKLIERLQSEDRAHRIGQTDRVEYIDLVCAGTVDEKIVENLRGKRDVAAKITGDELRDWL